MTNWIKNVTTTSVYEGPPGTLGADKSPEKMFNTLIEVNPGKSPDSIAKYIQFFINRAGKKLKPEHRMKLEQAKRMMWDYYHSHKGDADEAKD